MINLYIINENILSAVYGIGTYIKELIAALKGGEINVCVIYLGSERQDMEIEEFDGIRHWYIPKPTIIYNYQNNEGHVERYYRNVLYLLRLHIIKEENLVFHINHVDCKPLMDFLKTFFDCKIVLVVHYLTSIMALLGNISRLRRIISQTNELTDKIEKYAKKSYLKEKEMFQFYAVDKIVCLSNHAFDLLHQDYQVDKEKMVVIYNGLSDSKLMMDNTF